MFGHKLMGQMIRTFVSEKLSHSNHKSQSETFPKLNILINSSGQLVYVV